MHPATASRALNPETRILVSEETARRVGEAAAALGYRPNPVARSLRTRRSHTVGVLIPDLNNPLFPPIVRGLEDRLGAAGYVALQLLLERVANRDCPVKILYLAPELIVRGSTAPPVAAVKDADGETAQVSPVPRAVPRRRSRSRSAGVPPVS